MAHGSRDATAGVPAEAVTDARRTFLRSGQVAPEVRAAIQQSWARSARLGVDPDELHADHDATDDADQEVFERIRDVLARAAESFAGEPVSIIFAAPSGRVIHWHCSDPSLARQLEAVSLVPGVAYGEQHVGTNGIGTALELARPTLVVGGEHFNERLSVFACAGAPLHHPVTGALLGVVDITCAADMSNALLLASARSIASQLQDALLAQVSGRDLSLLRDYLTTSQSEAGPVLALGDDLLMLNQSAQDLLNDVDRAALVDRSAESAHDPTPRTFETDLPSGAVARLRYEPTFHHGTTVGGVFRVRLDEGSDGDVPRTPTGRRTSAVPSPALPGVVGSSPAWTGAVTLVRQHLLRQRTVLVQGEPGVGKLALIKAVHYAHNGSLHVRVFDCAVIDDLDRWIERLVDDLDTGVGTMVLQHLERLPVVAVAPVAALLREYAATSSAEGPRWVLATRTHTGRSSAIDALLAPLFEATVELAPLRSRAEDLAPLARTFLEHAAGPSGCGSPRRRSTSSRRCPGRATSPSCSRPCATPYAGTATG
ncbi:sigma-54-dependent transcriptional regulator family protein [Luteipulveratus halotolerans]|uniref:Sigma-54 factor interaction domain-containing protein n=1 Tax=Luteipulveratus halotolerans TaxID=1631356 RepID=A0A0L6CMI3_9MICO|nr:hypothetical protein [Luteipulveratus halotolerans]KNX38870.1 hypothetical protein VV01_19800 [Luteipulveratus halotolerans]